MRRPSSVARQLGFQHAVSVVQASDRDAELRTIRIADREVAVTKEKPAAENKLTTVGRNICHLAHYMVLDNRRVISAVDREADRLSGAVGRRHREGVDMRAGAGLGGSGESGLEDAVV